MTCQFPDTSNDAPHATLRDYFAAHAMMGLIANSENQASGDEIAECAYAIADAMLKARRK